jgi:hypothetical protein
MEPCAKDVGERQMLQMQTTRVDWSIGVFLAISSDYTVPTFRSTEVSMALGWKSVGNFMYRHITVCRIVVLINNLTVNII